MLGDVLFCFRVKQQQLCLQDQGRVPVAEVRPDAGGGAAQGLCPAGRVPGEARPRGGRGGARHESPREGGAAAAVLRLHRAERGGGRVRGKEGTNQES